MLENLALTVIGMKCGGCEAGLKSQLLALEGVSSVSASHKDKTAEIVFDAQKITPAQIQEAITTAGYQVE